MKRFTIATLLLALTGFQALAQDCRGRDLRPDLSTTEIEALGAMTARLDFPEGNHWRAVRGAETIDIIGTLHVDDPRHGQVMTHLEPVLKSAGLILLEATPEEEARMKTALSRDPSLLVITDGPTLPDLLAPDEWARLRDAAAERGIPGFMAAKFRPWYLSILLSMPPCMIAAMQEGTDGLDKRISDLALAEDIPMRSLEEFDTLFRLFGSFDPAEQAAMVTASIPSPEEAENMLNSLIEGYFDERHAEVWTFSQFMARKTTDLPGEEVDRLFNDLRRIVLTDRNAAWMPRILGALHETDKPVVVAAGAAHLSGRDGLLWLLEAEGFTLTRLPFAGSGR